jgi:hypothetical protein
VLRFKGGSRVGLLKCGFFRPSAEPNDVREGEGRGKEQEERCHNVDEMRKLPDMHCIALHCITCPSTHLSALHCIASHSTSSFPLLRQHISLQFASTIHNPSTAQDIFWRQQILTASWLALQDRRARNFHLSLRVVRAVCGLFWYFPSGIALHAHMYVCMYIFPT